MTTQEVANKLVELCRTGQYQEAQNNLYAPNAVSVEPDGSPWGKAEGLPAIQAKAEQWANMVEEVHSAQVSNPIVSGSHFACTMENDVTFKGMGRQQIREICVYEVKDGKIVKEEFFYDVQPPA